MLFTGSIEYPPDRRDRAVVRSGNLDAVSCVGCVHHHTVSDIDADVTIEADQVARPGITEGIDPDAVSSLGSIVMRKAYSKIRIYCHCKTTAVSAVCKT